jgi:hypothetical protein
MECKGIQKEWMDGTTEEQAGPEHFKINFKIWAVVFLTVE